jgi:pimeloyl-ACP methyl ester carboxylesterase
MALKKHAVEILLRSGGVVRGLSLSGATTGSSYGRGTILFVHDIGSDLDEFGAMPEFVAALGFDVVLVDLPGHGLSDGEEPDPSGCLSAVTEVLDALAHRAPFGLVSAGRSAATGASLGQAQQVFTQVLIRMVLHGDGPEFVGTETQRFFSYLIGEKILVFNASLAAGSRQVANLPAVQDHVELFLKRYLSRQS